MTDLHNFTENPNDNSIAGFNTATDPSNATDGAPHGSGILGYTKVPGAAGVFGANDNPGQFVTVGAYTTGKGGSGPAHEEHVKGSGVGVAGIGPDAGVRGYSKEGNGTEGQSNDPGSSGVWGVNWAGGSVPSDVQPPHPAGVGVWGHTTVKDGSGVVGSVDPNLNDPNGKTAGVVGLGVPGGTKAGWFFGDVRVDGGLTVTGEIHGDDNNNCTVRANIVLPGFDVLLSNADCAEEFDVTIAEDIEPGMVMVLGERGHLEPSQREYDKKVAGVISGAGDYRPAIVLDRQQCPQGRLPVAMVGKVFCKVDASYGPIEIGDLLTTSDTPGHAMKATDPLRAFGAVIGKALRPLSAGQGMVPILVALQ